jgi:hypothetical protein
MKRSTNIISDDGVAESLHITSADEAAACAHVRRIEGELRVEGAHFVAADLTHSGMVNVGWEGRVELPVCKTVSGCLQVWGNGELDIGCETVGMDIRCHHTGHLKMPECLALGQQHSFSVHMSGSALVEAPKLKNLAGGIDIVEKATLMAPHVAMLRARAALAAAQKMVEEAGKTGCLAAHGRARPVRMSTREVKAGLEAMPTALKTRATAAPAKQATASSSLAAVDPLAGAESRPLRRPRP